MLVKRINCQIDTINSIVMDGEEVGVFNELIKYLGIVIDSKINFKENAENLCKKVAKKIGVLSKISRNLTEARNNFYKSVIAPHFDDCSATTEHTLINY